MGRIAIICGAGIVSGKEIMALELGLGLREAGVEVHFLTARWGNGEFARRAIERDFPVRRMWLGFISATLRPDTTWMTLDQVRRLPSLLLSYWKFLREVQPTRVIHTNWHHALLLWPFLRPQRDIYWSHEIFGNKPQYRRLFNALAKRVGWFVAVSHAAAKSLVELQVPERKVEVIYNGIANPAANLQPREDKDQVIIAIVGQIGEWKGHDDLLRAFKVVLQSRADAQLHIFGTGSAEYVNNLRTLSSTLGITASIVWRDFIRCRSNIYSRITILAVPSRSNDPLPTSAIEAAFFMVPVVASRLGGLPEIVEHGVTGFLYEPGNVAELAEALICLIGDPQLRRKMGEKAHERAQRVFSRECFVRQFCEILQLKRLAEC